MFKNQYGIEYAPWSASKLKMINNCGCKFYMEYVYKAKTGKKHPEDTSVPPSKALDMGALLHKIAENAFTSQNREIIEFMIRENTPKYGDLPDYLPGLNNLYDRINAFRIKEPLSKLFIEHGFGFDLDGKKYKFFDNSSIFRVKFDLLIELDKPGSKSVRIIDIKSGKYYEKETKEQLSIYASSIKIIDPTVNKVSMQTALIAEKVKDLILTQPEEYADTDPKKAIVDVIDSYIINLPDDITKLTDKKYCATKSKEFMCSGCNKKPWCPKFGGTPEPII